MDLRIKELLPLVHNMDDASLQDIVRAFRYRRDDLINKIKSYLPGVNTDNIKSVDDIVDLFVESRKKEDPFVSTIYQCKRCQSKNVISRQEQMRGADEPSTTVLVCGDCGYHSTR